MNRTHANHRNRAFFPVTLLTLASVSWASGLAATEAPTGRYLVRLSTSAAAAGAGERSAAAEVADFEREVVARRGRLRHELGVIDGRAVVAIEASSAAARELAAMPGVIEVEVDAIRTPSLLTAKQLAPAADNGLYGLVTTGMAQAHGVPTTGGGVVVGVADTAIDCGHPDLAPNLLSSFDATGFDESCWTKSGFNSVESHATHVAGTIVAANNKVGVVGGAFGARLHHARVCSGSGDDSRCFTSDVIAGVRGLVDRGARIVNLSLGGAGRSNIEEDFYRGIRNEGILVIAASGNEDHSPVAFPAAYDGVLAVGAVDLVDGLATFSNVGPALDLVAPGVSVLSSLPRGTGRDSSVVAKKDVVSGAEFEFSPLTGKKPVAKKLIFCGLGKPEEIPNSVKGQIALIERGELFFSDKVANAMAKGAAAVVIYNHSPGIVSGTLQFPTSPSGKPWIPVVGVSNVGGAFLRGKYLNKAVTLASVLSDYGYASGTSMATPHAVAAAALVWGRHPDWGPDQVEARLEETATDLGAGGFDNDFGAGRINAASAVAD